MDNIIIRSAKENDLSYCVELLHTLEFKFPDGDFPDINYLKIYLDDDFFLVAEDQGKIIGCIFGEPLKGGLAIIWYFIVNESYRGQGIGKQLYEEYEKRIKIKGVEWLVVYVNHNEKALNFYIKQGHNVGHDFFEVNKQI